MDLPYLALNLPLQKCSAWAFKGAYSYTTFEQVNFISQLQSERHPQSIPMLSNNANMGLKLS